MSLALAGAAGVLGATALSANQEQTPQRTVTINLENGAQGVPGPPGPIGPVGATGPSGAEACPKGSVFGEVVINHPGGHVTILTCIKDE